MIPRELLPTVLIRPDERPPVARAGPGRPPISRTLFVVGHLAGLLLSLAGLWIARRLTGEAAGRRVRRFLERMGTVWMKAGQILSLRSDIFPQEFCRELAELRDRGVAFPFEVARRIAEASIGAPLDRYFEEFAETPFAATSIAQLHRARLRVDGAEVAVKIQQPGAQAAFATDFRVIRAFTGLLQRLGLRPAMEWSGLCAELHKTMTRELDFSYEASSLRRLGRKLRRHGLYVPQVFPQYSSSRVLVMEYIRAALMSDLIDLAARDPGRLQQWLAENDIEPRRVGRRLFHSVLRQVLEDNLFHGDLHPSNLILLRRSRLAVIDCRSVGSLDAEHVAKHRMYLRAIAEGEFAVAADVHFLLSAQLPLVDLVDVKEELIRTWRVWESRTHVRSLPFTERSLTSMFGDVNRVVITHRFSVQWSMTRLGRAFVHLDASLQHLHPSVNVVKWIQRYFAGAATRTGKARSRTLGPRANRALVASAHLPRMLSEAAAFQQGIVRRQARVFEGSTTKAGELLGAVCGYLALLLLIAGGFFLAAFVDRRGIADVSGLVGEQLAGLVRALPPWTPWAWLASAAVVLAGHRGAAALARRFAEKPVRAPEVPPAV